MRYNDGARRGQQPPVRTALNILPRDTTLTYHPKSAFQPDIVVENTPNKPTPCGELPKGKFTRKTSLVVSFTEAEKGKPVYYAFCYDNAKGEQGPWSQIEEAIIV